MDVMDAIKKRRSIRNYKPDDIPENVLRAYPKNRGSPNLFGNSPNKLGHPITDRLLTSC